MALSHFGIALLLIASARPLFSGTVIPGFTETTIVGTGIASPTGMAVAPDGRVFVTQQGGQVRVIQNGSLLAAPALSLTVDSAGERGLIGIALDPNFASNGFAYLQYTVPGATAHNQVSRVTLSGNTMVPGSELPILQLDPLSAATNHNGGTIEFGPDGKLYVGAGENANPANSQTLTNLLGKILRINPDGTIPSDNPFASTLGARGEIFAYGLRNPFQFTFDPNTGSLFANDVGQNTFEEIDVILAGNNYGWPITEGLGAVPGLTNPLFFYDHTIGPTGGCAITGGTVFQGDYFFADLCSGWIRRLALSGPPVASPFLSGGSSIVSLRSAGPGGFYYLQIGAGADTGGLFLITADAGVPEASSLMLTGLGIAAVVMAVRLRRARLSPPSAAAPAIGGRVVAGHND